MELTKEMLDEVKDLASADEIIGFAEKNGAELSKEEAEKMYYALHAEGELDDDALDEITGGAFLDPSSWFGKLIMRIFGRLGNGAGFVSGTMQGKTNASKNKTATVTDAFARGRQKGVVSLGELEKEGRDRDGFITL